MSEAPAPNATFPLCDTLILTAVSSEIDALSELCKRFGIPFKKRSHAFLGSYYDLGLIGFENVIAVRSRSMGPLGYGGSAELASRFQRATGATSVIQLGMAFGVDETTQQIGDVLVSTDVIPYDHRHYRDASSENGYLVSYESAARMNAAAKTVNALRQFRIENPAADYNVHFGAILSGAAIVHSSAFRDELLRLVPPGDHRIVGGEMEGIGLLGVTKHPIWCVVKGICDFADANRDRIIEKSRVIACRNAADFLLSSMIRNNPVIAEIHT